MKLILYLLIINILLISCNNTDQKTKKIETLKNKKDSINNVISELKEKVKNIQLEIEKQDTTKKYYGVTVIEADYKHFSHYFDVLGTVESKENIIISSQINGEITNIYVTEGQHIKKGEIIAKIKSDAIEKDIKEVNIALTLATDLFHRQKRLWDKKIGSEIQYLKTKQNKESLEQRLASLRSKLELTIIKAPFDGFVDEIFQKIGQLSLPGSPFVRIINLENIYIICSISENYLSSVHIGSEAIVKFTNLNLKQKSKIKKISKFINPNNRTFTIQIKIDNTNHKIIPNLMAKIKINDFTCDTLIVLPSEIIQQTPDGENFVYIAQQKENNYYSKKVFLEIGKSNKEGMTVIKKGLKKGQKVIKDGSHSLEDQQRIEIFEY